MRYIKPTECYRDSYGYLRHGECRARVRISPKKVRSDKRPVKPVIMVGERSRA